MTLRTVSILALALVALVPLAYWMRAAGRVMWMEYSELRAETSPWALAEARRQLPAAREVSWEVGEGLRQRALYQPPGNGALVIFVHGSPGSAGSARSEAGALARAGYGALLLDLPGYGGSEGQRTWGDGYQETLRRAIAFAEAQPGVSAIGGFGYSMGTAVLAEAAARDRRLAAVVLVAAFTRLDEQLRYQFRTRLPGIATIPAWTARALGVDVGRLEPAASVARLSDRPLLLIAGDEDPVVPVRMPRRLNQLAPGSTLWVVRGAGHVGFEQAAGAAYHARLRRFFDRGLLANPP